MHQNYVSCRPGSYGKFREHAFAHLASIGVRHLELGAPPPEQLPALLKTLAGHGLSVASLEGRFNLAAADRLAALPPQIEAAKAFGAKLIFLSVKAGDLPRPEAYARLRELGDTLAPHGLTAILETHPDLITNGSIAAQTMRAVNHPNVRVNFDTANVYYYNEGIDGVTELEQALPWIAGVHLKETNGKPKTWFFPALGEGIVNFPAIFARLAARRFIGPYTLEIEGCQGDNLDQQQTLDRVAKSVAYLRAHGLIPAA